MSLRQSARRSTRVRPSPPSLKRERSASLTPPPPSPPSKIRKIKEESPLRSIKHEASTSTPSPNKSKVEISPNTLKDRKLKAHSKNSVDGPFPTYPRPTPSECSLAYDILSSIHGKRTRPKEVIASKDRAGCGDSPSVLDALVRTILSQNTSDQNSTRAKLNMDKVYGGSDEWDKIVEGGQEKLKEAIKSGGLSEVKSKVILKILNQAMEKYQKYSLDHLFDKSTEEAMNELLSFDGVGPKTASCVLLFCLGREDFAVDTHVQRITGLLNWHPPKSSREQTYHHLNKRIPDEFKYGLHILFVLHGKVCEECKAGGRNTGKCELRKAFRDKVVKGEDAVEQPVKEEIKDEIKEEVNGDAKKEAKEEIQEESVDKVKEEK